VLNAKALSEPSGISSPTRKYPESSKVRESQEDGIFALHQGLGPLPNLAGQECDGTPYSRSGGTPPSHFRSVGEVVVFGLADTEVRGHLPARPISYSH